MKRAAFRHYWTHLSRRAQLGFILLLCSAVALVCSVVLQGWPTTPRDGLVLVMAALVGIAGLVHLLPALGEQRRQSPEREGAEEGLHAPDD